MKFFKNNQKILTVCLIGMFFVGFTLTSFDEIFEPMWKTEPLNCLIDDSSLKPKPSDLIVSNFAISDSSEILVYLFQIMFILFLISPPIIALTLFCIWKELKKSIELK